METNNYNFGIGGVEEILLGEVMKEDRLSVLKVPKDGLINRPKLVGVYHQFRDTELAEQIQEAKDSFMNHIIVMNGLSPDRICPELICIGFDPTAFPEDLIWRIVNERDVLRRLKVSKYFELDGIDFEEKGYSAEGVERRLSRAIKEPSKPNISVVEREVEILKMLRRDYGLRRTEAVDLAAAYHILRNSVKSDILYVNDLSMIISGISGDFAV